MNFSRQILTALKNALTVGRLGSFFLNPTICWQFLSEHNSTCAYWLYFDIVLGSERRTQPTGLEFRFTNMAAVIYPHKSL